MESTAVTTSVDNTGMIIRLAVYAVVFLFIFVPFIITTWNLFSKAHKPGWAAVVPFYWYYIFGVISKKHMGLTVAGMVLCGLYIIPVVGYFAAFALLVVTVIIMLDFIKQYRASPWFWVAYILAPIISVFLLKKVQFIGDDIMQQAVSPSGVSADMATSSGLPGQPLANAGGMPPQPQVLQPPAANKGK